MPWGLWIVVGWMVLMILGVIVFIAWGFATNQFHNIEEAKFKMLEDKEPQDWPKHKKPGEPKEA